MITRREAKEIVDFVIGELTRKRFPYITDGKIDLTKTVVGPISGTPSYGGGIADGAIYDRHVHPDADIRGTKVRVATTSERGTVQLGTEGSALIPTMSGLLSTVSGLGASLIGVHDGWEELDSDNVEDALHEILEVIGALTFTFLSLTDTPNQYIANWSQKGWATVINQAEDALEFKPIHYVDGGGFSEEYAGAVAMHDTFIDGESFTENNIMDGGNF